VEFGQANRFIHIWTSPLHYVGIRLDGEGGVGRLYARLHGHGGRARGRGRLVTTTFQGDQVNLVATFWTLKSWLTYMAYGEVNVPTKQTSVQMQNFDYNRGN
jgi:hypothetical protein